MYQNLFTPVQHIRRPKIRPGGLCWVVFTPVENVENWPTINPENGQAITTITLKPGKTWYDFKVVDKDKFFTEGMKVSDAGPYWEHAVTGYIGGNNTTQTLNAYTLPHHDYVIMLNDRDGQIRLIGNADKGAEIQPDYTSGDSEASRKWFYRFLWQHPNPATIYVGDLSGILDDVIEPPFTGQGSFNNDFNNDFDL